MPDIVRYTACSTSCAPFLLLLIIKQLLWGLLLLLLTNQMTTMDFTYNFASNYQIFETWLYGFFAHSFLIHWDRPPPQSYKNFFFKIKKYLKNILKMGQPPPTIIQDAWWQMVHTGTAVLSTSPECYMARFVNLTWHAGLKSRHKMALLSAIRQSGDCYKNYFFSVFEQINFYSWLAIEQKISWLGILPLAPLQVQLVESKSKLSVNF